MNDEKTRPVEYRGTGFYVGLAAILLFAVILLIVAVQNTQNVTVEFLGWNFRIPLFGVAIGAALIAVVIDELVGLVWRKRRRSLLAQRVELASFRDAVSATGSDSNWSDSETPNDKSTTRESDTTDPKSGEST